MNNKVLGIVGMIAAPFLYIDFELHGDNHLTGLFEFIYMSGWMCSIVGLYRLEATGTRLRGRSLLLIQLFLLSMAQLYNLDLIIESGTGSVLQKYFDWFWPISNAFMFLTGIVTIAAGRLPGWKKFIPLLAGFWLPAILLIITINGNVNNHLAGGYSTLAWFLLAIVVYTTPHSKQHRQMPAFQ